MNAQNCGNCRHVNNLGKAPACRRFPPMAQVIFTPKRSMISGQVEPQEEHRSMFPTVRPDWSCGEWAAMVVS